jgi:hypothetical protein
VDELEAADDLLYICDSCYKQWHTSINNDKAPIQTPKEPKNVDSDNNMLTYYIIRKNNKRASAGSIVDTINIDKRKFKDDVPKFVEVLLPPPVDFDDSNPLEEKENKKFRTSINRQVNQEVEPRPNKKGKLDKERLSPFRSSLHAYIKDNQIYLFPKKHKIIPDNDDTVC